MTIEFTASSLPRAFACLASIVHPRSEFRTKWADLGKERHKVDENAVNQGDLSTLPAALSDLIVGMDVRSEVAMAFNASTRTARILGYGVDRDYGVMQPFETPGTCDLLAVGNGRVIIGDRKGWEEVDHPSENRQTLFYALCAAIIYSVTEVTVCIYGEVGEPRWAVLDWLELQNFADELKALHIKAMAAQRVPRVHEREGEHCTYCHAFENCSKQQSTAIDVASGEAELRLTGLLNLDDDETAGKLYVFGQKLHALQKRFAARIYARAAQRPIPVPNSDGLVFGKRLKPGNRTLDPDKATAAIREILGLRSFPVDKIEEFESIAFSKETSQAAIERAAKQLAPKGGIGKLKEQIVDRIGELGGIARGTTESFEEYKPEQPVLASGGSK